LRSFKSKEFAKWQRKEQLPEETLLTGVQEIRNGLIDANLGGYLIKKRLPKQGQGKSGGYRTLLAYKKGDNLFFIHGFGKNEKDNITRQEKEALKMYADILTSHSDEELNQLVMQKVLFELE
jgi:hypothetical protein